MCGFVGFTGYIENNREIINKMMDRIIHRGPDMAGDYCGDGITLGFRRLSIIDLSEACRQPMTTEDGRYTLVFNGEIYNFMEIRSDLEQKGWSFRGNGDGEVLLKAYAEYGEKVMDLIRGMFAFVIWDEKEKTIFGARDFFGIKPFYYSDIGGELLFGSEIKSFLDFPKFEKKVNRKALLPYLTFQYSSQDETFFEGVFKLPPAHCFRWKDGKMEIRRYWDVDFSEKRVPFEECVQNIDDTVRESVT